ncbi:folylpolyglutamate synthase/FOL3/FOLC/dihydrofolate synthetase [Blumeria hordei DH14]|uniref:Dihydrofolate synthetase n=1 Tax=Blumeria graminis f. sp. hordei (strain DH14) TaxID=546991 RepID=N1JCP5_BLUG1|nr:folylpolyglutamate synthase/FOL3/FOLC/dihydrofolate synthetase [Blumeria hordei DH14]
MIDLGLVRTSKLIRQTPQTWKAIHVAGTNGKGSICAYLSAMFTACGIRCGRFSSPHLIDRWDGISIEGYPVRKSVFLDCEKLVSYRCKTEDIKATEFEILTATAFEAFAREKIEMGIVEVGLGGRLDSTNTLKKKEVTIISKIGLDHQSLLGNTIEEIAREKAGIMQANVPCVIDSTNETSVRKVIEDYAKEIGTQVIPSSTDATFFHDLPTQDFEPHQIENLACAYTAFLIAYKNAESPLHRLLPAVLSMQNPGRLQLLDIKSIAGRDEKVLLDGAHNIQSAEVLSSYVEKNLRRPNCNVTWVVAASHGKDLEAMLGTMLKPGDDLVAVKFHPVDRMPWVRPMETDDILSVAHSLGINSASAKPDLISGLRCAAHKANGAPMVIAGSLYLVSDVLKLLRDETRTSRPIDVKDNL